MYRDNVFQFLLWDEFTLTGQHPEFLKLLFAGSPLLLPIKGGHVHKTDNPFIITCANHSLRDLVLRKYSARCDCKFPSRSSTTIFPLCNNINSKHSACSVTPFADSFYRALCARIQEVHLENPLFPSDPVQHDLTMQAFFSRLVLESFV